MVDGKCGTRSLRFPMQGRITFLPGEIARFCDHKMVAPLVVMHGVIGQKSAEGIVVDSLLMKRRPEAKRENSPLCSIFSMSRPVHIRVLRRGNGNGIFKVNQNGFFLVGLTGYDPTLLVTVRCGPACRLVWEEGDKKPLSIPIRRFLPCCSVMLLWELEFRHHFVSWLQLEFSASGWFTYLRISLFSRFLIFFYQFVKS